MEDFKVTVPAEYIAVLKLFTATKDIRYYLNGINIEAAGTEARLIATDGHRLGIFRVLHESAFVAKPLTNVIIPNELLVGIKPTKRDVVITIGPREEGSTSRSVTLSQNGTSIVGKTIDGRYPDYRRVIPREVSGEAAQFNANYIGDLGKAARILYGSKYTCPTIGHNGDKGALIDLGKEDFVGVLNPMRGDFPKSAPTWAYESEAAQQEAA